MCTNNYHEKGWKTTGLEDELEEDNDNNNAHPSNHKLSTSSGQKPAPKAKAKAKAKAKVKAKVKAAHQAVTSKTRTSKFKIKFMAPSSGSSSKDAARASGAAEEGGDGGGDYSDDQAPENETQADRKRRLNRINERKKRARKVVKIETLTADYHNMTSSNQSLKEENETLRERIEMVKKYMADQSQPPNTTSNRKPAQSSPKLKAQVQTTVTQNNPGTVYTQQRHHAPSSVSASLPPRATSSPSNSGTESSDAVSSLALEISNLPREQRIRLLQHELEKQQRIILRLQLLTGSSGLLQGSSPVPVPVSSSSSLFAASNNQRSRSIPSSSWPAAQNQGTTSASLSSSGWHFSAPAAAAVNSFDNRSTNSTTDNILVQELLQNALRRLAQNTSSGNDSIHHQAQR